MPTNQIYDIIIIGAGPAGLTAGLYAVRDRMDVLLVEGGIAGGQMQLSDHIENYPGLGEGISGAELAEKMLKQAEGAGLRVATGEVIGIDDGRPKLVKMADGAKLKAQAIIVATGANPQKLGVPGEAEFLGKGVSYCATCDGPLFRGKDVVVIGGGDTAVNEALYLTKLVNKVILVHRRDRLRATKVLAERALANKKIEFAWKSKVVEILGKEKVSGVSIEDVQTNQKKEIRCDGVFIFAGIRPNTEFLKGLLAMDESGFIITDQNMKTSKDGIYAAGDVRNKLLRQISTAVGEGATAAFAAQHYVEGLKGVAYK